MSAFDPKRTWRGRAWSFVEGAWKEINRTEAYIKARLIGEHEFRQLFGELPPPPAIPRR
jgi:hypothetical protein